MSNPLNAGRKFTSGLFKEYGGKDAPYSLDNFKRIFLESCDSSGYLCAQEVLHLIEGKDRWQEWKRLFERNPELRRHHETWKEELEVRTRAEAEKLIASGCDKMAFPRLRYILDGDLYGKRKVGRPSKGELTKREKMQEKVKVHNKKDQKNIDKVIELADAV